MSKIAEKIIDKQKYFDELNRKLKNDFDFLFEDDSYSLNNFLTNRLYSKKEFEAFKKTFSFNYEDAKLRYIFEHSQQYAEIVDMTINDYCVRMFKSEIKYSKDLSNLVKVLANMEDKVTLEGYLEIIRQEDFKQFIKKNAPAKKNIEIQYLNLQEKEANLRNFINKLNEFTDSYKRIEYITENMSEEIFKDKTDYFENRFSNTEYINVFNKYPVNTNITKPDYGISFKPDYYGGSIENPLSNNFFANLFNDNLFNEVNAYIKKRLEIYNQYIESLNFSKLDCRIIRTVLYWITYFGKASHQANAHMDNIKNAEVTWAVGTEKETKASFYGNSKLAKAFSSYYAYMNATHNPYKRIINNKEHEQMDANAIAIHKLFGTLGLDALDIEGIVKNTKIVRDIIEVIQILDQKLVVNVNIGDYISGFVSSMLNSVAQLLEFTISMSFQQLFFLKIIPFNGKKISLSDLYNYVNFLKILVENIDNAQKLSEINEESMMESALNSLGLNVVQFREIGWGAYDSKLNSSSGIVFFINVMKKSYKNKKYYWTCLEDLPVLYSLIEFALEKKAYNGDYYAKKNIILSSENEIYSLLEYLTKEEIAFVLYKLNIDIHSESTGYYVTDDLVKNTNRNLNTSLLRGLFDGVKLYEEYKNFSFEHLKKIVNEKPFLEKYSGYISKMLNEYFEVIKFNREAITKTTFVDKDLGEFDDFIMRFLPSILEFAKFLNLEEETKEALVELLDKILNVITSLLFEKVLLELKRQIDMLLKQVTTSFEKAVDDLTEKIGLKNTSVEFDLGLGLTPLIGTMKETLEMIDEFINKLPKAILPCFINGGYGENEALLIPKRRYRENPDESPTHGNPVEPDLPDKNEKIDYKTPGDWKVYYINKSGTPVLYQPHKAGKFEYSKIVTNGSPRQVESIERIIEDKEDIPKKIVYRDSKVELVYQSGKKEKILEKKELIQKKGYIIKKKTIGDIEQILSEDHIKRLKEIQNFLDRINNIDYYEKIRERNNLKNKLVLEHNKAMPNMNEIKELEDNIRKLTDYINNAKNYSILNNKNKDDEIKIFSINNKKKIEFDEERYKDLDEFFNQKIQVLKETDEFLQEEENTYLSTYQITELLK